MGLREKCHPARAKAPVMMVRRIYRYILWSVNASTERLYTSTLGETYVKLRILLRALCQNILLLGGLVGSGIGVGATSWKGSLSERKASSLEGGAAGDHGHGGWSLGGEC